MYFIVHAYQVFYAQTLFTLYLLSMWNTALGLFLPHGYLAHFHSVFISMGFWLSVLGIPQGYTAYPYSKEQGRLFPKGMPIYLVDWVKCEAVIPWGHPGGIE